MKISRILSIFVIVIFCFTGISLSDDRKDESRKAGRNRQQYNQHHQDDKGRLSHRVNHGDKKRHDYHKHDGYRERPYQKNRHYRHYDHKGHRYEYQGHWKSWKQWDRYAKEHADLYKHGSYYRENAHLMFRFCDPITGGCLFFSIGK